MGGYMNYKVVGNKNKKQLIEKIARHSIQLAKEDCIELPEKIYEKRILEMNKELSGQYESMRKNLMLEISEDESITAPIVLTKLLRLQQILSGQYLKAENEKLDTLWEIIEEVLQNKEKIIVWARFRASIDLIINLLEKKKVKYSLIHGDIKDRQTEIDKFQEGNVPVFIGQIRTGGMGITLTAGNTIIYYENTFSLEDRKQSEDRAHRIGQKKKCLYIDLVYKDTIDEGILEVIEKKQDIAHCLVNNFKKGEYGLD
jgi:SNF2 family DNA or RNA helicase